MATKTFFDSEKFLPWACIGSLVILESPQKPCLRIRTSFPRQGLLKPEGPPPPGPASQHLLAPCPTRRLTPRIFFLCDFCTSFFFGILKSQPLPPPPSPCFGSLGRLPDAGVTGPIASARSGPVANFPAPFVGKPAVDSFLQEFDIPGLRFVLQETTDGQHSWPAPATGSSFFSPTRDSPGGWPARCPPPPHQN